MERFQEVEPVISVKDCVAFLRQREYGGPAPLIRQRRGSPAGEQSPPFSLRSGELSGLLRFPSWDEQLFLHISIEIVSNNRRRKAGIEGRGKAGREGGKQSRKAAKEYL